ncbi:MAG: EVE domain-containing protein [Lachnospiraceae bacterium]|nr:EVE domain-containing protein [Lachnospiraceae bacterium]MCM1239325.1 EVE domain-containing protein [Lachnospiraceae bacterium]
MIDLAKLNPILEGYKAYFPSHWDDERYKWEAIKHFQDHWNIDAENFGEMFKLATDKTLNLLASGYAYPRGMIINFAKADDEAARAMFRNLYDESKDLAERVDAFQTASEELRAKYDDGTWKNHYQNTNAISTYLWLRYPDKYYIYKYELFRAAAGELESEHMPKKNGSVESLIGGFQMYDEICNVIKADPDIRGMIQTAMTASCYPDPEMKTATIDVGFYLGRFYLSEQDGAKEEDEWFPDDYSPELSVDDWVKLLGDSSIFTIKSLQIMKRMKDYGGAATCKQLSVKYGENPNFYNGGSWSLAQRIAKKTGCPAMIRGTDDSKWWPVLYVGRKADKASDGAFIWKLRDELTEALDKVDLNEIDLYADNAPAIWKISHGSISDDNRIKFEGRQVVVVRSTTKAKAMAKVSQGENFMDSIKKGDYFYLCYGSSIRLLGQFVADKAVLNPEMADGWYEREYRLIKESKDTSAYKGIQKWWTPNDNSTCIKVESEDKPLFEDSILKPYFGMTLDELFGDECQGQGYWWLTVNPRIWSFSEIKIGEEQSYTLYNENGNKRRIFQNFLNAKAGDIVIGYEADPVKKVVAIARITQANDGKAIYFEKVEGLTTPVGYLALKECPELGNMEFCKQPNGSLFKLEKGEYDFIMDIIRDENPLQKPDVVVQKYTKKDFLRKVYMTEERFDVLEALLRNKMNVILQGAPGVGKTFTAKKLAYAMMGEVDDSRIEMVQFHQNYSYEDFIMGYRPDGADFKLTDGIFYKFCRTAANHPDKEYFFIIDEINRGNMSKIFGELLMLIERDYRGTKATLAYNGMPFSVPENLFIIGMMNTADRSLAMIDYALRRRFSFFEMEPGFNSEGFTNYQKALRNETFNVLIEQIRLLNKEIAEDKSLGRGFQIGHSYFCGREELGCTDEWMRSVVEFDILPMLSEYWFDEPDKLTRWEKNLRGVFDD